MPKVTKPESDLSPEEVLEEMVPVGTAIFAFPKSKLEALEAARPKRVRKKKAPKKR